MVKKIVTRLNFICVRPFSHKAKFCLFCKQIYQQEVISSAKDFFTTKIFSTVTKVQRCRWENLEAHNVLSGDNLLFSLTAILCQVILFCRHDLRRKTLHVSDASKVANRVLVQLLVFSDVAWPRVLLTHLPQEILPKKMRFEPSQAVFWSLPYYKKPKLTIKPFTGCTLHGLLI